MYKKIMFTVFFIMSLTSCTTRDKDTVDLLTDDTEITIFSEEMVQNEEIINDNIFIGGNEDSLNNITLLREYILRELNLEIRTYRRFESLYDHIILYFTEDGLIKNVEFMLSFD